MLKTINFFEPNVKNKKVIYTSIALAIHILIESDVLPYSDLIMALIINTYQSR